MPDQQAKIEPYRALVVTSRGGTDEAFVSRMFAPRSGIPEDPVTGSAHCLLAPYWSRKLETQEFLVARQVSAREGLMDIIWDKEKGVCHMRGDARVIAEGQLQL